MPVRFCLRQIRQKSFLDRRKVTFLLHCQLTKLPETQNMLRYVQKKLCHTHARKKCGPEKKIGLAITFLTSDVYLNKAQERKGNPQPGYVTTYRVSTQQDSHNTIFYARGFGPETGKAIRPMSRATVII